MPRYHVGPKESSEHEKDYRPEVKESEGGR